MTNYLIEMKGIVKRFPGVLALDHVDFQLQPGEVHMLLGENGAGKSRGPRGPRDFSPPGE